MAGPLEAVRQVRYERIQTRRPDWEKRLGLEALTSYENFRMLYVPGAVIVILAMLGNVLAAFAGWGGARWWIGAFFLLGVVLLLTSLSQAFRTTRLVVAHQGLPESARKTMRTGALKNKAEFDAWLAYEKARAARAASG